MQKPEMAMITPVQCITDATHKSLYSMPECCLASLINKSQGKEITLQLTV